MICFQVGLIEKLRNRRRILKEYGNGWNKWIIIINAYKIKRHHDHPSPRQPSNQFSLVHA